MSDDTHTLETGTDVENVLRFPSPVETELDKWKEKVFKRSPWKRRAVELYMSGRTISEISSVTGRALSSISAFLNSPLAREMMLEIEESIQPGVRESAAVMREAAARSAEIRMQAMEGTVHEPDFDDLPESEPHVAVPLKERLNIARDFMDRCPDTARVVRTREEVPQTDKLIEVLTRVRERHLETVEELEALRKEEGFLPSDSPGRSPDRSHDNAHPPNSDSLDCRVDDNSSETGSDDNDPEGSEE